MSSTSPISAGLGIVFRRPSIPLAEIAWRWSFAAGTWFLISIFLVAYTGSLPVSAVDRALLRSGQPALIARALHRIFSGSGFRFTTTGILLALGLIAGWIVLASFSRLAIVRAAAAELGVGAALNHRAVRSLLFLNFLRVAVALAAVSAIAGSIIVASSFWASTHISSAIAALLVGLCWLLAWISWTVLNWLLSFMIVLVPVERGAAGTFASAAELLSRKTGALFVIGILFGCCHLAAFVAAWVASSMVLGLSGAIPLRAVAALEMIVVMAYCALADFFYTGRLVAYVSLLRPHEMPVGNSAFAPPHSPGSVSVDKDELILSDVAPSPA